MQGTPLGLVARPFDFLVAFLIFFAGAYGLFLDPYWPPDLGMLTYVIYVEDIYFTIAGLIIMAALVVKQCALKGRCKKKYVVEAFILEMFAWLFVSVAAIGISVTAWVIPPTALDTDLTGGQVWAWAGLWLGTGIAAFVRWRDMRRFLGGDRG